MSTIEWISTMSHKRVMQKHSKGSLATLAVDLWHVVNEIEKDGLTDQNRKRLQDLQTRAAWG